MSDFSLSRTSAEESPGRISPPVVSFFYDSYQGFALLNKSLKRLKSLIPTLDYKANPDLVMAVVIFCMLFYLGLCSVLIVACLMTFLLPIPLVCLTAGLILLVSSTASLSRITLNQEGFVVWKSFLISQKKYAWVDLQSIVLANNGVPSRDANQLILNFRNGRKVVLDLNGLSQERLMTIINVASFYKPTLELLPLECRSVFRRRHFDELEIEEQTFTELWQNDFERRFAPTSFVPLEQGAKLQDGMIEIVAQIATGGMSAVYLTKHKRLGTVVLKESVLPGLKQSEASMKAAELFRREAILLSLLDHPRIVRIYDYFTENDRHYLLLEHLCGRTLRSFIKRNGPVQEKLAIEWSLQLARILEYLHNLDTPIVHRDFTPDNLIISADSKLRVVDFGASSTFLSTATGTVVGKMAYMPPEQLRGKASPASDIYALGGVMCFLMSGADPKPYEGQALSESIRGKYPRLAPLVEACLELKLTARINSSREVVRRLEPFGMSEIG